MKVFYLIVCITMLTALMGCAMTSKTNEEPITQNRETYYPIEGTLIYHDPASDRGNGTDTSSHHIVSLIVYKSDFPYFDDFFQSPKAYFPATESDTGMILLGCTTGEQEALYATVTSIDTIGDDGKYITKREDYTVTLPLNGSGVKVHALVTRPVTSYSLSNDLPDTGRPGSCEAHAKINILSQGKDFWNMRIPAE